MTLSGFVQYAICPTAHIGPGTISRRKETNGDGEAGAVKRGILAQILPLPFQVCGR